MVQCWMLEAAGLPALFVSNAEAAGELLRQARVNAQALQQQPFTGWRLGHAALTPQCRLPGQMAAARRALQLGRLPWALGLAAREALEAAVVEARAAAAAAGPAGAPGMDVDSGGGVARTGDAPEGGGLPAGAPGRPLAGATGPGQGGGGAERAPDAAVPDADAGSAQLGGEHEPATASDPRRGRLPSAGAGPVAGGRLAAEPCGGAAGGAAARAPRAEGRWWQG